MSFRLELLPKYLPFYACNSNFLDTISVSEIATNFEGRTFLETLAKKFLVRRGVYVIGLII